jgi:hypothetical protein
MPSHTLRRRQRGYFSDPEGTGHAIMLADGDIVARNEGMTIELEEWLVAGLAGVVIEAPAMTHMTEHAVLGMFAAPETADAAMLFFLTPCIGIHMAVGGQGCDELVAVLGAAFRIFRSPTEFQPDAG